MQLTDACDSNINSWTVDVTTVNQVVTLFPSKRTYLQRKRGKERLWQRLDGTEGLCRREDTQQVKNVCSDNDRVCTLLN
jgi:hypothetical protein